tara:strand:- start:2714 stop:3481 length:768 start_codon:yes stop_codon:yes gene_type:complete
MKTLTFLLISVLINTLSIGQNSEKLWRYNPAVSADDLQEAQAVNDLSNELWQRFQMPSNEREVLNNKLRYTIGYQLNSNTSYASLVKVVSSTIKVTVDGNESSAKNTGAMLGKEQKQMLKSLRNGDEFDVLVQFEHLGADQNGRSIEASTFVTILPHQAADFTGGISAFNAYLEENLISKIREDKSFGAIDKAMVSFWVDKKGSISKVKLIRAATNERADRLILDVLSQMPNWIPAKTIRGEIIEQEVKYSFGGC